MAQRYFGRQVQVETAGPLRQPAAFTLEGQRHSIVEIMASWADYGFGSGSGTRPRWWQRHHRNYYRVLTSEEEVYEIYYDRGTKPTNPELKRWYVTRKF